MIGPDDDSEVRFDARWEAVRTVDLPALDDFGAQSDTAWAREKLYQLVAYRVKNDLPTVVNPQHCQNMLPALY